MEFKRADELNEEFKQIRVFNEKEDLFKRDVYLLEKAFKEQDFELFNEIVKRLKGVANETKISNDSTAALRTSAKGEHSTFDL